MLHQLSVSELRHHIFSTGSRLISVLLCDETLLGALREGISALGEFLGTDGTDDQWLMCLEHGGAPKIAKLVYNSNN